MSLVESLLLGLLQGLTEFLPVSSSGHLVLASALLGLDHGGVRLNVILHAGTLLAMMVVLRHRLVAILVSVRRIRLPDSDREAAKELGALLVATLATVVVALALRKTADAWSSYVSYVGWGLLATAVVLWSTRRVTAQQSLVPLPWAAALIGLAQGVAVLPGLSRSGLTIAVALFCGFQRKRAFEFSMLLSFPIVAGALLVEGRDSQGLLTDGATWLGLGVAFVSGVAALLVLRKAVQGGAFSWFAAWVAPLGILVLLWGR